MPDDSRYEEGAGKVRYPTIKYFLSKERDPDAPVKSVFASRLELKSRINLDEEEYVTTEKDRYDEYDIEYGLGYHKSINQFIGLDKGNYIMHVKVQKTPKPINFQVIFSS